MRGWQGLPMAALLAAGASAQAPAKLADTYANAIRDLNERHAKAPGKETEAELGKQLPAAARQAFAALLATKGAGAGKENELATALATAAAAAADLDLADDFAKAAERLATLDKDAAGKLGILVSRPRFVVRGVGLERPYLERFADVADAVLRAYDETFGFRELSKVPGKKLRFRVHLVPKIEKPPHFAPEFPWHSQVDFPVADAAALKSPTPDGKFLFYGLCHELGHVVAMWGARDREEDHHTWAHYCGVVIVEALSRDEKSRDAVKDLRDVQWRSLTKERDANKAKPGTADRDSAMSLWIALHDQVGPRAIGAALNDLDAKDKRLRVNRVRYYTFAELKDGLLATLKEEPKRKAVADLIK